MFGTVQELGRSQKGAPKLKIDGKWYFAGRSNVDGITQGMRVEFESSVFGQDQSGKDLHGLQKIRPAPAGGPNGISPAIPQSAGVDEASLRFISNVVGSALAAGTLKDPVDVLTWTKAAQQALKALSEPEKKPDFEDDELPDSFYDGLPPQNNKAPDQPPW